MTIDGSLTRENRVRSAALAGLLALTVMRLVVAASAPLSADEAYYWVWSRALAPGYLDHPPMVALWIWLGTLMGGEGALGVRVLAPLSAAGGSVVLAAAGARLFSPAAGLRAAVMLNATLMLAAGAVTMTPDTPLLLFWTLALYGLARLAVGGEGRWWLAVGGAAGLGLDSKYTAALLGVGIAVWLLTPAMRRHLVTPWPYLGGALALALTAPVLVWNAQHAWVSVLKQGGRVGASESARALQFLGELLGGQVGLATPIVFALAMAGLWVCVRRWREPAYGLVAALVVPGLLVFVQHAFGARVQANWVAILYPAGALAAALVGTGWWRPAAALGFALSALLYVQAAAAPFVLPRALDPTLRLAGWQALTREAEAFRPGFIAAEDYAVAAMLAWHSAGVPILSAEPRWRLFDLPETGGTAPGVLLLSTRHREPPDPAYWRDATLLATLVRGRGGVEAETYRLYRVVPNPGTPPTVLPQRTRDAPDRR